ncbi:MULTISPECIES: hypothetical protein [Pasteurellaceae]|uniref:Uncharacterized protein n=3 Tax=Actinobacillus TaxID=713 RepID=A0A828PLG4_ACTPL|nr:MULTISPECIES: hypothetical protein [Pasteurellaceae]AIJ31199.1 hypothetical protein ASU1_04655 [Actinobacillus suis ATCC 33415]AIZ79117.1 hypothetical protein ACEE_04890 [Actinobacillus equuli subsp. equuli]EFL80061.1 hypothetical protein APP6_0542 [Actinobacillus pleuropneumoniae serovar 6 str. Femo]EFM92033.1 hypothetical protein appser6_9410 [Actinobacillus pleuropneumoniae serovar 6 str. Femo]MCQ9628680.1 hypothetical protein [Actinobacillus suis]
MNPVKLSIKRQWLKNTLKVLSIIIINILVILFTSSLIMNNTGMFNVDFQSWFYDTRLGWFLWRIVLYTIVLALMFAVNKYVHLSLKAKLLIASSIILIEGLNLFYLLG